MDPEHPQGKRNVAPDGVPEAACFGSRRERAWSQIRRFGHRWALLRHKVYVSPPKYGCIAAHTMPLLGFKMAAMRRIAAIMRMYHRISKDDHEWSKKWRQK